jgi:uncharacterized membrane protein (UPF0127 family)
MGAVTIDVDGVQVRVARSFGARLVGLLGRRALAPEQALLLVPCDNVHTFFMRFAIDVVFVDRDGVVLAVVPRLAPWRVAAARRAHACLELAAGVAAVLGLEPGRRIAQLAAAGRMR